MPDTPEGRLGKLERELATLQQQVKDIGSDVDGLTPVRESVIRIEETIKHIEKDINSLGEVIRKDREEAIKQTVALSNDLEQMRKENALQANASRTQLIAGVISIITTLLIVAGTIIAAGGIQ